MHKKRKRERRVYCIIIMEINCVDDEKCILTSKRMFHNVTIFAFRDRKNSAVAIHYSAFVHYPFLFSFCSCCVLWLCCLAIVQTCNGAHCWMIMRRTEMEHINGQHYNPRCMCSVCCMRLGWDKRQHHAFIRRQWRTVLYWLPRSSTPLRLLKDAALHAVPFETWETRNRTTTKLRDKSVVAVKWSRCCHGRHHGQPTHFVIYIYMSTKTTKFTQFE